MDKNGATMFKQALKFRPVLLLQAEATQTEKSSNSDALYEPS
jgi:hypothetical protein